MDDLTVFYTARLNEAEAAARAATPGEWLALDGGVQSAGDESQWPVSSSESDRDRADRVHIALHDPAAVLRDIAANRAILAEHPHRSERPESPAYGFGCDTCHFDREYGFPNGINWCQTVRLLAATESTHPDYRSEWRPSG